VQRFFKDNGASAVTVIKSKSDRYGVKRERMLIHAERQRRRKLGERSMKKMNLSQVTGATDLVNTRVSRHERILEVERDGTTHGFKVMGTKQQKGHLL